MEINKLKRITDLQIISSYMMNLEEAKLQLLVIQNHFKEKTIFQTIFAIPSKIINNSFTLARDHIKLTQLLLIRDGFQFILSTSILCLSGLD